MNTDAHRWAAQCSFLSVFIGVHLWLFLREQAKKSGAEK
jgi:hypothetical protein